MEKELLLKYIKGGCTRQEKLEVAEWLDSEPGHMKEYISLRKLYDITIWQIPLEEESGQRRKRDYAHIPVKAIFKEFVKIAAVLTIAFIVYHYVFPVKTVNEQVVMQTLLVPAGQRAEITLEDGSRVFLNAKSTLTFPNRFIDGKREVCLDGEGFFEVATDKTKPFFVKTGKFDVKVLGTKFNLMAYSESPAFETSLLEGSVEILGQNGSTGAVLKPGEQICFNDNRLVIAPIEHMDHFLWKEGIISFNDETFLELVEKLELYFDVKIVVENDIIRNYKCTGKFRTKDGVEHILKVLQLSNNFKYKIDEKRNIITIY